MTERQSKKKKEKEPIEKTHPKGCICQTCLNKKIGATTFILNKEIQLLNEGMVQLENELNQEKQIHKMMYDFLIENHRAELLPDNSAIVKWKRRDWIKRKLMESWINRRIRKAFGVKKRDLKGSTEMELIEEGERQSNAALMGGALAVAASSIAAQSSPEQQQEAAPKLELRDDFWEGDEVKRPIFKDNVKEDEHGSKDDHNNAQ